MRGDPDLHEEPAAMEKHTAPDRSLRKIPPEMERKSHSESRGARVVSDQSRGARNVGGKKFSFPAGRNRALRFPRNLRNCPASRLCKG
ncbi:hypothetical protein SDC9_197697 [bioreactor metagenome]|uniref:Uncharacterized protein n=1 Tax=bioreactor metagenome TaxID=1076179 RepID=A0A645IFH3_9ZZZZ